jgi:hypothetical protein
VILGLRVRVKNSERSFLCTHFHSAGVFIILLHHISQSLSDIIEASLTRSGFGFGLGWRPTHIPEAEQEDSVCMILGIGTLRCPGMKGNGMDWWWIGHWTLDRQGRIGIIINIIISFRAIWIMECGFCCIYSIFSLITLICELSVRVCHLHTVDMNNRFVSLDP